MTEYNHNADKFDSNPEPDVDTLAEHRAPHDVYETGLEQDKSEAVFLAPALSHHEEGDGEVKTLPVDDTVETHHHEDNVFAADDHVLDNNGEESPRHDEEVSHDDQSFHPVPEGLGEHREGESLKEWLANDLEQTKKDLHIGHDK